MLRERLSRIQVGWFGTLVLAIGLLYATAARAAVILNIQTPESGSVFNFCTNNFDTFTGVLHTIATETFSGDGSLHVTIHQDNHDIKLSDPLLGDCEGQDTLDTAIDVPPGTSTTETANISLRMECSGAGGNQDATFAIPFTVDPNGNITVGSLTLTGVECR